MSSRDLSHYCPERDTCLGLKGAPIGMYHCPSCGEMLLAGLDTIGLCPRIPEQPEPQPTQEPSA